MDYRDAVIAMHRLDERRRQATRQEAVLVVEEKPVSIDVQQIANDENIQLEMSIFAERHKHDLLQCPRNALAMVQRVLDHARSRDDVARNPRAYFNADAFERAFQELTAEHNLIPPPSILVADEQDYPNLTYRERTQKRAADIGLIKEVSEKFGEPVTNYAGKVFGYNLPAEWNQPAAPEPKFDGRQTGSVRPIVSECPIPEDEKPSRAEFAGFTAAQLRSWLESRGYLGGNIPPEAFRD